MGSGLRSRREWPDTLNKVLDKEDLSFYKNALRMRNYNLGIAAVAYLRRVVENKINDVLDVLAQAFCNMVRDCPVCYS